MRGVLSSWETSARNSALARAASSERSLGALAFADVARGRLEADYLPLSSSIGSVRVSNQVVSRHFADTVGYRDGPPSFERLLVGFGADALQILGMKEIIGVRAEEVFRLVAEQTTAGRADVEVASVRLVQADEVAGLLREQAELLLVLSEASSASLRSVMSRAMPSMAITFPASS